MKRASVTTALTIVGASIAIAAAHFLSSSAALSGADLTVKFREAGLGNNQTIVYVASATADALYVCVNGGDKNPKAANKRNIHTDVSTSGSFTSDKNGSLSGQLTIQAPGSGSFSCPSGQTMVLQSVSYTNVGVTDTKNNVTESISGTYSQQFTNY